MEESPPSTQQKHVFFHTKTVNGIDAKFKLINDALSVPQYSFENFVPYIDELIPEIQDSTFAENLRDPYDDFFDFQVVIADLIAQNDINELYEHPSEPLEQLLEGLRAMFDADIINNLTDSFPLNAEKILQSFKPDLQKSCAAIASLTHENAINKNFIMWIGNALIPQQWHGCTSAENMSIKLAGYFMKYRRVVKNHSPHWAILSPQGDITIYLAQDLSIVDNFHVNKIESSRSGHSIRVFKDSNIGARLIPYDRETFDTWLSPEPLLPRCLAYYASMIPEQLIDAFETAIIQPDTYLLRAILHHDVLKFNEKNQEVMEALLTIFSYHNLVHRFLMASCALEFSSSNLDENNVLRSNSHVTLLFKVYYKRYGRVLFDNILKPIINKINEYGPLNIKEEDTSKIGQVEELLNWVIEKFLTGGPFISDEFRHMASVLKTITATRLRSKHAVFNALSSFFCLRFSTAIIADPNGYDSTIDPTVTATTVPFAQLLQLPFNLQPMTERYNYLGKLNEKIIDRYEEIYNYVLTIADIDHPVEYRKPSHDEVVTSIKKVMEMLNQNRPQFVMKYTELYENDSDHSASSFAMSDFITKLFR